MKSIYKVLFSLILINVSTLCSEEFHDWENEPISFEEVENEQQLPAYFWRFEADADWIGKAGFTTPEEAGHTIRFFNGDFGLSFIRLINGCEGIGFGVGYNRTQIDWKNNGFFCEDDFRRVEIKLQGFSFRYPCWEWKGGIIARFDDSNFDFYEHTTWDFVLWGRYKWQCRYWDEVGLNFGIIAKAGIDKEWYIPIIGVDFNLGCRWRFNLVFPTDLSIHYSLSDSFSIVATNRFWDVRYRLAASEPLSKGIFEYRNSGLDVGLAYQCGKFLEANVHIGTTYSGGDMKIANKNNHTIRHNKIKSSMYLGANAELKF